MQKILLISIFFISINCFAQDIASTFADSNITAYDLLLLKSQIDNEKEVLSELNQKINFYQDKVTSTQRVIDLYKSKLEIYSDIFANLIVHFYFVGINLNSTSIFLLSSNSFNQAFNRYNYLKLLIRFISRVKKYLLLVEEQLSNELRSYENYSHSLDLFLHSYQDKKVNLDNDIEFALISAKKMEQNADKIRTVITSNYVNYKVLDDLLKKTSITTNTNNVLFKNLSLPLYNSVIISSFGDHSHPYLKNIVITNDGIDLFSSTDTVVKAIFSGKVVYIVDIPNFGKSVILKHGEFYSVYSNLHLVYVSATQSVKDNQVIGTISVKTSKYSFACLNLQIWHNTEKLNPVNFLNFDND